jgi:hypothetical protein
LVGGEGEVNSPLPVCFVPYCVAPVERNSVTHSLCLKDILPAKENNTDLCAYAITDDTANAINYTISSTLAGGECGDKSPPPVCLNPSNEEREDEVEIIINEEENNYALAAAETLTEENWYLDSGCTSHVTSDKDNLSNLKKANINLQGPIGESTNLDTKGTYTLYFDRGRAVELLNTIYSPNSSVSLMSVQRICKSGLRVLFEELKAYVLKGKEILLTATLDESGLYRIDKITEETDLAFSVRKSAKPQSLEYWHERFAHLNYDDIIAIAKMEIFSNFNETSILKQNDKPHCIACDEGKMRRKNHARKSTSNADDIGDIIHSDICGPLNIMGIGRKAYFITFLDEHSDYSQVIPISNKSEAFGHYLNFVKFLSTQSRKEVKVRRIKTDKGGEYTSNQFKEYLMKEGTIDEKVPTNSSRVNGRSERLNLTIMNPARTILFASNLHPKFWPYAVVYANYVRNLLNKKNTNYSRYKAIFNREPSIRMLAKFGCFVMYCNTDPKRKKLDKRALKGIFVGVTEAENAFLIYDLEASKVITSRDVKFYPNEKLPKKITNEGGLDFFTSDDDSDEDDDESVALSDTISHSDDDEEEDNNITTYPNSNNTTTNSNNVQNASPPKQRAIVKVTNTNNNSNTTTASTNNSNTTTTTISNNNRNLRSNHDLPGDIRQYILAVHEEEVLHDPISYKEAMNSPQAERWKVAINEENAALKKMRTFEEVDRPTNSSANILGSRYVFKVKHDSAGNVLRYKARLVAKGYTQTYGVDYLETFAPTLRTETFRFIISYQSRIRKKARHLDIITAFLNGILDTEIYMEAPVGYKIKEGKVLKLLRGIYGLKQAMRIWIENLSNSIKEIGFIQSSVDPCLFLFYEKNNMMSNYIAFHVDDIILGGENDYITEKAANFLSQKYDSRDLGYLEFFVGIKIGYTPDGITLSQKAYAEKILSRVNMNECRPAATPLPLRQGKEDNFNDQPFNQIELYRQIIGSIMYLSNSTRPDITYATNYLARYCNQPTNSHYIYAKRVLRYIKATTNYQLLYKSTPLQPLIAYADASYAEEEQRKSTSGFFCASNGLLSWRSIKQSLTAQSTMEAELFAINDCAKEVVFFRKLSSEFYGTNNEPTIIYEDNTSCRDIIRNPITSWRTKHIEVEYFYVRELYDKKIVDIQLVSTNLQLADILTKSLPKGTHHDLLVGIGIIGY